MPKVEHASSLSESVLSCNSKKLGSKAKITVCLEQLMGCVLTGLQCSRFGKIGTWSVWFYFNVNLNCGAKEGAGSAPLPKCSVGISLEFRSLSVLNCSLQSSCSAATFNNRFGNCL